MTTLENAAAVLKLFQQKGVSQGNPGLTFTDVVEALRLPKSTVSRLLATMESQGMLERDADSRCFHIGRVLLSVAGHYLSAPLVDSASPAMARLADKTGSIGYISRLDGRDLVVMRMFHGRHFTQLVTPPGSRMLAAATSTGRVLLAQLSEDEVRQRYHDAWQTLPPNSPQTLDALCAQLAEIRRQNWSLARNETLPGISSISVALHNKYHGDTVALCLSFLSQENATGYPPALLEELRITASDLAEKYGATPL
ncbi:IclR family transcriptional regulator [Pantoea sp. YU22]|uniref:IclR family transcriptional regulator n=1 Tax=Pantoea TaxID=53335 RepID=UPI000F895FF1|nr:MULTISPECIES: IclR family transcriptional regulator [Pantoea]RTY58640.1 IclR family transcriptional regulator [Pantoea sp. YU22]WBV20803.1 IclR family transcriptional regulator [Pantoea piersonii]